MGPSIPRGESQVHFLEHFGAADKNKPPGLVVETRRSQPGTFGQILDQIIRYFDGDERSKRPSCLYGFMDIHAFLLVFFGCGQLEQFIVSVFFPKYQGSFIQPINSNIFFKRRFIGMDIKDPERKSILFQ
jgi:hypothetical protein